MTVSSSEWLGPQAGCSPWGRVLRYVALPLLLQRTEPSPGAASSSSCSNWHLVSLLNPHTPTAPYTSRLPRRRLGRDQRSSLLGRWANWLREVLMSRGVPDGDGR